MTPIIRKLIETPKWLISCTIRGNQLSTVPLIPLIPQQNKGYTTNQRCMQTHPIYSVDRRSDRLRWQTRRLGELIREKKGIYLVFSGEIISSDNKESEQISRIWYYRWLGKKGTQDKHKMVKQNAQQEHKTISTTWANTHTQCAEV